MRKIISIAFVLLLNLPSALSSTAAPGYTTLFCPECWQYLSGDGSTDLKGNCAACGKYPLELEVQTMSWFWCRRQHQWLRSPCLAAAMERCCTLEESQAVVAGTGSNLVSTSYCPLHRTFKGYRLPVLGLMVCVDCARPMEPVRAVRRAWFWCVSEGYWAATPCPMDPVKHCCARREGLLLATPVPGPIAKR
jgi:hypothetical protein